MVKWNLGIDYVRKEFPDLYDASEAYTHYLDGTGTDLFINYEKAYKKDTIIRGYIDDEIFSAQVDVETLYSAYGINNFNITGKVIRIPNGSSENWQKTLGSHYSWGSATVSIDDNSKATMVITIHAADRYNFNKGATDIATGIPDNVNGRFAELGWAKSFMTYGEITRTVT